MRKFITDNDISFEPGSRNSSVVTLIGYAQYLGWDQENLEAALNDEIKVDGFIGTEIDRLWDYCKANNYKKWWSTKQAKAQYKF
jgi:hypothetical protein